MLIKHQFRRRGPDDDGTIIFGATRYTIDEHGYLDVTDEHGGYALQSALWKVGLPAERPRSAQEEIEALRRANDALRARLPEVHVSTDAPSSFDHEPEEAVTAVKEVELAVLPSDAQLEAMSRDDLLELSDKLGLTTDRRASKLRLLTVIRAQRGA